MQLTIRGKLFTMVAIAAVSFFLLVLASALLARNAERQLEAIHDRYLPKVELEPQLALVYEQIRRGFQDAVSARDAELLAGVPSLEQSFLGRLAAARDVVDPKRAAALRTAMEEYFDAAMGVSRRLMADEAGEAVVAAVADMQEKQARADEALKNATAFDRNELTKAFADAARAERTASAYRLAISIACLGAVVTLSTILGRSVLRSMKELTSGFARFGTGDFSQPIAVSSGDELGEIGRRANAMAANLDRLDRARKEAEAALTISNKELEAFSYAVAHDLRAPLRGINGFSQALLEDWGDKLDDEGKDALNRIAAGAGRMGELIDALLALSRVTRAEVLHETVDLSQLAETVMKQLRTAHPDRSVSFVTQGGVVGHGDSRLLRALLDNLLGNAWKFTRKSPDARIEFGSERSDDHGRVYYVRDNGAGFDMAYAAKLFAPFQRLHAAREFEGTGIGLATVQRIVHRHGGRIWAEGAVGKGATFRFTLAPSHGGTPS